MVVCENRFLALLRRSGRAHQPGDNVRVRLVVAKRCAIGTEQVRRPLQVNFGSVGCRAVVRVADDRRFDPKTSDRAAAKPFVGTDETRDEFVS